ncbi:Cleavage polyadenylation factor subunit clp1 [Kappamyces sp. JEL0829]|nr:Cleavage polyadenylation factor subunit clp1 [Kappamyces sp. JEL0829]KAJ3306630.1 Cleavage polyadenylation factor subunit clp1 [Kappamyces sp. JEL0829]
MNGDQEKRQFVLKPMQEFRFEVENKAILAIRVTKGKAELFGTELAIDVDYQFTARKLAIFTWHGCELETWGKASSEYIGEETPMNSVLNVHFALQKLRQDASMRGSVGPKVMVVGPSDVGKTSLVKTLASYAARSQSYPILADIDPGSGLVSVPETLSAMAIHRPIDPEEEFNGTISLYKSSPITYYYGSSDIKDKKKVYLSLVASLAGKVKSKLNDKIVKSAGLILDTPAQFIDQGNFELLYEAMNEFEIDVVLVIGHERLLSNLQQRYKDDPAVSIVKIAKSGGYFYGSLKNELTPFSQTVAFTDIIVRRAQEGSIAPSSTLPIGMEANPNEVKFVKVETGDILLHSVLAVSYTPLPGSVESKDAKPKLYTPEEEADALLKTNIQGFIYVSEIDDSKRKMTILSPSPGRLPKTFFINGALKWLDG